MMAGQSQIQDEMFFSTDMSFNGQIQHEIRSNEELDEFLQTVPPLTQQGMQMGMQQFAMPGMVRIEGA